MNANLKSLRRRFKTSAAAVTGFSLLIVLTFCSLAAAQKFDIEDYLKKKDNNRNGKIEESEMSDSTKGILKKLGFDPSNPVSISKIVAKVNKDRKALASGKQPGDSDTAGGTRQVPGFGVETAASATVARFGATESSPAGKSPKFSESVMERVASTLERYDRNKDGSLDESEMKKARWGSPPPGENDTNRDGKLSRKELAYRYLAREQYYRSSQAKKSDSDQGKEKKKLAEEQAKRERERERFRNSGTGSTTSSARPAYRRTARSTSGASSGSSAAASQAKYQKYADSLISKYDKDNDGKLNKEEVKQMRRPPVGADADKDGVITQSELVDSLSGANKTTASSAKSEQKTEKTSSKYARKDSTKSARYSSSGSSSSFDKLDSNLDRHVQMHEFSNEWDDETVAEFYEKDKNGDGVITLNEWSGRN